MQRRPAGTARHGGLTAPCWWLDVGGPSLPEVTQAERETGEVPVRAVLRALAEEHRADLVRLLVDSQLAVRDLVARTGMAQPLVSHHLRVLRDAGLVESTVCGGLTVYRVRADTLEALAARLSDLADTARVTSAVPPC